MPFKNTTERDRIRHRVAHGHPACHICGQPIDYGLRYPNPGAFVVDHLLATARGGTDSLDNLRPAHAKCNNKKQDRDHAPIIRRSPSLS